MIEEILAWHCDFCDEYHEATRQVRCSFCGRFMSKVTASDVTDEHGRWI